MIDDLGERYFLRVAAAHVSARLALPPAALDARAWRERVERGLAEGLDLHRFKRGHPLRASRVASIPRGRSRRPIRAS